MARASPIQTSMNAGELSTKLDGRVDIARRAAGLQFAENLIPEVYGGGQRRSGSRYVAPVRDHAKATYLLDFRYAAEQAYELEFGEGYVRFYRDRAPILEASKSITNATQANPVVLTINAHGYVNGQDVEIGGILGMRQLNGRRFRVAGAAANTFQLHDQFGNGIDGTAFDAYVSGGVAARVYTLATPYLEADLAALKYAQSNDALYLAHPNYVPRKLLRLAAAQWALLQLDFADGPYLPPNPGATTLAPSGTTGAGITISSATTGAITNCTNNGTGLIRVTCAGHGKLSGEKVRIAGVTGTTEANGVWSVLRVNANSFDLVGSAFVNAYVANGTITPVIFAATDLGRLVRIRHGSTWGIAKVVGFTSEVSVTADVLSAFGATTAQTVWRLGLYSQTGGYPAAVTLFEDRLFLGGCPLAPTRGDLSATGDYENFPPSAVDGTVTPDHAIQLSLNSGDANVIRWAKDDEKGLLIGTIGGEWLARANSLGEAMTPTNRKATRATAYGSADRQPVRAGKDVLFPQRGQRKLRNLAYAFEDDGFRAGDVTLLSEHMSRTGLEQQAFQSEPNSVVWSTRGDGQVPVVTYARDQEAVGWARQILGGVSDAHGYKFAECRSVACIPAPSEVGYDEVWVIVRRFIDGRLVQYVEFMTPAWEGGMDQQQAWFVDSGLAFDGAVAATLQPGAGATVKAATNVPFVAGGNVFAAGDVGRKIEQRYFDWTYRDKKTGQRGRWRSAIARITAYDSPTQVRCAIELAWRDLDLIASGAWRLSVTRLSGAWHLEGQIVQVNAGGAAHPDVLVVDGEIALDRHVTYGVVGLGYVTDLMTLRLEAGAQDGTAQGKLKRIGEVTVRFHQTLGARIGHDFDNLFPVKFRTGADPMDQPPPIQDVDHRVGWDGGYSTEGRICIRQDQPFPMTVLAIMPQVVTYDKG